MGTRPRALRALVLPHGRGLLEPEDIPSPPWRFLREAVASLVERTAETHPKTVVLLDPHGVRVDAHFTVARTNRLSGVLEGGKGRLTVPVDTRLSESLLRRAATAGLPVLPVGFGAHGSESVLPLSWGALVPLTLLTEVLGLLPIVLITPPPHLPLSTYVAFGRTLRQALGTGWKDVLTVVSGDMAHAHDASGPYGFHPAAAAFDDRVLAGLQAGDLQTLLDLEPSTIEGAKADALPPILVLAGLMEGREVEPTEVTYACPTYFGMAAAGFLF